LTGLEPLKSLHSPLNPRLGEAKHEIGTVVLKQRNGKTFSEDISKLIGRRDMLDQ
jgi:hypothetical protein